MNMGMLEVMIQMNRQFDLTDKKDKFIKDHLLTYMMKRIDECKNSDYTAEKVASMYIFPYKTEIGVKVGSLKEPGVSWYYTKEEDENIVSSDSYRILADNVLTKEQAKLFRQTFSETGYISEFSDVAVIKDIIQKMSREQDYTALWWNYAYDVVKLWNPEEFNDNLSDATSSIDNNYFLFLDHYCSPELKEQLLSQGIFKDVITSTAQKAFWDKLQMGERKKALTVLQNMGVPHTFVYKGGIKKGMGYEYSEIINSYILGFIEEISRSVVFPIGDEKKEYEMCKLAHEIINKKIFNESRQAFSNVISDENNDYKEGIVVKNVEGKFVPISWDLFYDDAEFGDNLSLTTSYLESEYDEKDENIEYEGDFESLHIDVKLYGREFIGKLCNIHKFAEVDETIDNYNFNVEGTEVDFYKWVWNYSQHEELVENILYFFSGDDSYRETVSESDKGFVLSILKRQNVDDRGYCFDIDCQIEEAFCVAETINRISRNFEAVYGVIYGETEEFNVQRFVPQILAATKSDFVQKGKIITDAIWNHVYLIPGENGRFDGTYVNGKKYDKDNYEDALFLWKSEDENSYIRALARYVQEKYNTIVSIPEAEVFDWKNEYFRLIRDVRAFISEKHDVRELKDVYGNVANMDDVCNFGEEKKIWSNLKKYREKIVSHEAGSMPVNVEGWRDFLSAKYKGRCQLCDGKIAMSEQKSYFWTFRMVKESDNRLANLKSNLFCLCPACHGKMRYGNYMGKDMSKIVKEAKLYAKYIEDALAQNEFEDDFPCLIQEWADDEIAVEGFHKPIVFDVTINGEETQMVFSWEHFMRIAFIFSTLNDFEEEEIIDDAEEYYDEWNKSSEAYDLDENHDYMQWHGTEYVSGHWRNRNGHIEWVSGHWRTR